MFICIVLLIVAFVLQSYADANSRGGKMYANEPYVEIKTEDDEDMLNKAIDSGLSMLTSDAENTDCTAVVDTPNKTKKSSLEPRTPTPFKNALDEFRKRREQTWVWIIFWLIEKKKMLKLKLFTDMSHRVRVVSLKT